jgi:hypothetical protein
VEQNALDISRHGDQFSIRVHLPLDIAKATGRKEIWKSPKTPDRSVAKRRAALLNLVLTEAWGRAERGYRWHGYRTESVTGQLAALIKSLIWMLDEAPQH